MQRLACSNLNNALSSQSVYKNKFEGFFLNNVYMLLRFQIVPGFYAFVYIV